VVRRGGVNGVIVISASSSGVTRFHIGETQLTMTKDMTAQPEASAEMVCSKCGALVPPEQRYCGRCGAAMARSCPGCGAANPAANRFCGACGAKLDAPATAAPASDERRWATVLFADISGFTSMSERMDAEDVKGIAQGCAARLAAEVRRFGGTVLDVMGDAVLAAFGAPVSHEDDAERAVRAALAIRDCALGDAAGGQLRVHVGVHTGEVMAGSIGPEERQKYTIIGDTVNTAARIMSAASPGAVLVGEETHRATQEAVRYRPVPPIEAKGKVQPVPVWEALEVLSAPAARPLGGAALVGRAPELALLSGIWSKVIGEHRPHLVTVLGEPGIGKSRLVRELELGTLADALVLHGRCLPYGEAVGYWALSTMLREAAGITPDDAGAARSKLEQLVVDALAAGTGEGDPAEMARHLALLGGLDVADDRAAPGVDQTILHASCRRFFEALARRHPLCLSFEDVHWADGALLDLIESVAARAQGAPLLIVAQARPELLEKRPTWGRGVRALTSLSLEPLDERAAGELIATLCRQRGLPEQVAGEVGRGAGGNPLFAEELVATVAERGAAAGTPSALKALISARLDALRPADRRTLQLAAVLGKAFWSGGLPALGAAGDVAEQMQALEHKDLIRVQARSQFRGEREYVFKHDLIRDVAYETLPRAERRLLHGRAVEWVERAAGEQAEQYLDVLAHHALQAEQPERAIGYLSRAAERARRAAAHREEAALLARAIALATPGQADVLLDLHRRRGAAFNSVGMWGEASAALETVLQELPPEWAERRAEVLCDLAWIAFWRLDQASVRRCASETLVLAQQIGRDDLVARGMSALAAADQADGDPVAALDGYRRAMARGGGLAAAPLAPLTMYLLGKIDEAVEGSREAVELFRAKNETLATMWVFPHHGLALAASGRYAEAAAVFEEAARFGREREIWPFLARSISMSVGFRIDVFDFSAAEALAEQARDLARRAGFLPTVVSVGIDLLFSFARRRDVGRAEGLVDDVAEMAGRVAGWHGWLWKLRLAQARAEIALARGDARQALRWAADAIEQSHTTGRVKYEVAGLGTHGQALAALGRTRESLPDLRRAVALARPVGDPAMFLRAATALLAVEGDDALLEEARATATRIAAALPDDAMRRRFADAEPIRFLAG
jgi:class 3 adenylate cyclase/tetratricopeptide (TPR) repeat protein